MRSNKFDTVQTASVHVCMTHRKCSQVQMCQPCSLSTLLAESWEVRRLCVCELTHVGNEPANQDKMKIKREGVDGERQLPLMNNICPKHTVSIRSALLLSVSIYTLTVPVSITVLFPLPLRCALASFSCHHPTLLPRGTVGCWESADSNRCLIIALTTGRSEM